MRITIPALLGGLLLAGCGASPAAYPTPPARPAETIPLPPVSEAALIWQPGDWVYDAGSYRYQAGRYVLAAGHSQNWTFGHWAGTAPNYTWVPGGWTR